MKPNEGEETQREVEEELARRASSGSLARPGVDAGEEGMEMMNPPAPVPASNRWREKSWFGKKCVKIFRVFSNTFAMTFLAEWGDRSQLATIVLAGSQIDCLTAKILLKHV